MTIAQRITQMDSWLLDTLFQPVSDRLPENMSAMQLGMSFQLGSVLLYGAALLVPILTIGAAVSDMIDSLLIWLMGFAFFLGLKRSRPAIRPGMLNPLRPLLLSMRVMSFPFLIYAVWRGLSAPEPYWIPAQLMSLSEIVFVLGLYLIACQPRPPFQRMSQRRGNIIEGLWPAGKLGRGPGRVISDPPCHLLA